MNVSKKYPPMLAVAQARELELELALRTVQRANEQIAAILDDRNSSAEIKAGKIACLVRIIAEQCDKGLKKT